MSGRSRNKLKPDIHEDLKGFKVGVDSFGEINSSYSIEKLNDFLNDKVADKKLKDRTDLGFEPKK